MAETPVLAKHWLPEQSSKSLRLEKAVDTASETGKAASKRSPCPETGKLKATVTIRTLGVLKL